MSSHQERTSPAVADGVEPSFADTVHELIANAEVVSFDVFDTLIVRAIDRPIDAFALVKLRLLATDAALNAPRTIDAFPDIRVQAELSARDAKERAGHAHREVTLAEIYDAFAALSGAEPALVELLQRTELAVERDLVYANPLARDLFAFARSMKKTIVLCSDMYLPSAEVAALLRRCGYEGYDALYVSCEHACSKHAGTMFPYVAERHGVQAARIVHIGDNPYGDCLMAQEAGCAAVHVPPAAPPARARTPWHDEASSSNTVGAIVAGLWRKHESDPGNAAKDPWERTGFRVFGPLFTGFLLWLAASVRERRPDKLLFLARDTHFIHRHMPAFLGVLPGELAAEYAHVSRGSLLLPSFTDFPIARLDHLFSGKRTSSVRRHLRRLGLLPDVYANDARAAGFADLDELVPNGEPRMRVLLGKLHHELLRAAAKQRPLARRYIAQQFGDAKRVMLVDVGWVGNLQASIVRLLGPEHEGVEIAGHYVGVFRSAAENAYPDHTMHGWLTRPDDSREIDRFFWWSGAVEMLEFAMTAPHGTTTGYAEDGSGTVVPVIESNDTEKSIAELAARLQKGAADFIAEFLSAFGGIPPEALNSRAWGAEFYRLVTAPAPDEAELLGDLTHGDVAGDTSIRAPLAPAVASPEYEAAAPYYWKAGFIIRNGLQDSDEFSETAYLELNPDVRDAVADGTFASGTAHWEVFGRNENRVSSWTEWMRSARELSQGPA